MTWRRTSLLLLVAAGLLCGAPRDATGQLGETASFLAHLSNEYRVLPNLTYHVASNHENKLGPLRPERRSRAFAAARVYPRRRGGSEGRKRRTCSGSLPYLETGWAVANVEYRLGAVARAPARGRGRALRTPVAHPQRGAVQPGHLTDRHDREFRRRPPSAHNGDGSLLGRARPRVPGTGSSRGRGDHQLVRDHGCRGTFSTAPT